MGYAEGRVLFRSKAIRGAGDGSRGLQRKSDCVFPATKDVTVLQKRPAMATAGPVRKTVPLRLASRALNADVDFRVQSFDELLAALRPIFSYPDARRA